MSSNPEVFNAATEMKVFHGASVEHLATCRPCVQRTANHALGNEEVHTDVQLAQMAEISHNNVDYVNKMIEQFDKMLLKLDNRIAKTIQLIEEEKNKTLPFAWKIGGIAFAVVNFAISFFI